MRRARYRLGQFLRYGWPRPLTAAEQAEVRAVLSLPLATLFARMPPGEQAHGLRVLRRLRARGCREPALLQAALLHDVGKTRAPPRLWERALVVLARRLLPRRSLAWGQGRPRGWRRPFVVSDQHPAWAAELCAQAGAAPLAVELVRLHAASPAALANLDLVPAGAGPLEPLPEAEPFGELLAALQSADDAN